MKPVLECPGHRIDAEGFHPVDAKVKAIKEAPTPTNPSELNSFLGMLNFYGKLLPDLSSTLEPLHERLWKEICWTWGAKQQEAFDKAKNRLQSSDALVHYDPEKELEVSCDASLWYWGSPGPCYERWFIETSCICLTNTFHRGEELWAPR